MNEAGVVAQMLAWEYRVYRWNQVSQKKKLWHPKLAEEKRHPNCVLSQQYVYRKKKLNQGKHNKCATAVEYWYRLINNMVLSVFWVERMNFSFFKFSVFLRMKYKFCLHFALSFAAPRQKIHKDMENGKTMSLLLEPYSSFSVLLFLSLSNKVNLVIMSKNTA